MSLLCRAPLFSCTRISSVLPRGFSFQPPSSSPRSVLHQFAYCQISRNALSNFSSFRVGKSYRNFRNCISKSYATVAKDSFATVNANVPRDVLVFTYDNSRLFKWVTVFGLVQFAFWTNLALFCYRSLNGFDNILESDERRIGGWWMSVIKMQQRYKDRIALACLALGYIVLAFTIIYPLRTIARLTLLKGGQVVKLSTYSHFGRVKDYAVPLKEISCRYSRASKGSQVSMKLKGRWFYYMMDKRDGVFHDTKIFDYVIGLNRFSK